MKSKCFLVKTEFIDVVCTLHASLFTHIVRNRYVEYASGRLKDASQIPAEW